MNWEYDRLNRAVEERRNGSRFYSQFTSKLKFSIFPKKLSSGKRTGWFDEFVSVRVHWGGRASGYFDTLMSIDEFRTWQTSSAHYSASSEQFQDEVRTERPHLYAVRQVEL